MFLSRMYLLNNHDDTVVHYTRAIELTGEAVTEHVPRGGIARLDATGSSDLFVRISCEGSS